MTRRQKYERKSVSDLRFYAGPRALGINPEDVEHYLGKRASIHTLTKAELVNLHMKLDRAKQGLGKLLS